MGVFLFICYSLTLITRSQLWSSTLAKALSNYRCSISVCCRAFTSLIKNKKDIKWVKWRFFVRLRNLICVVCERPKSLTERPVGRPKKGGAERRVRHEDVNIQKGQNLGERSHLRQLRSWGGKVKKHRFISEAQCCNDSGLIQEPQVCRSFLEGTQS